MERSLSPLDLLDGQLLIHLLAAHHEDLLKRLHLEGEEKNAVEDLLSDNCSVFLHLLSAAQGRCLQLDPYNAHLQKTALFPSWDSRLIRHVL